MKTIGRRRKGQTATEYMLAVSVIVIAISFAIYQLVGTGNGSNKPMEQAFTNGKNVVEAPYP